MSYTDMLGDAGDPMMTIGHNGHEQWIEMNRGVTPIFYMEPVENPAASAKAGRPIFDEIETVRIFVAGDPFNQISSPVTDHYRERFAEAYGKWKADRENADQITGTPLRQWPLMTPARLKEFEALAIFNVEGLAAVADAQLSKHHGLREWRDKASAWLKNAADNAFAIEMAEENQRLKDEMATLKSDFAELSALVKSQSDDERRGPGRPRKDAV
ncbi:hypothetical protein AB4037_08580 [Labrys sp. KB_33_2]|uniref:hypothetical protein n=1 Tax=Labrys sp. KB_33_2 TaxID=3237479 RepID=UPI003F912123